MKGYNGLVVKDVWKRGDNTTRPKPDYIIMGIGNGAEKSHYASKRVKIKPKRL